jgi:glutathione synthase/RimK-type ligase-like ATP-grasp enzyme
MGTAEYEVRRRDSSASQDVIVVDGRRVDLDDVTSVWYRRRPTPTISSEFEESQRTFALGELRDLVDGILPNPDVRWLDYPANVWRAERKLAQLDVAARAGLRIPDTLVSTRAEDLRSFLRAHGQVVCKPIYRGLFRSRSGARVAYTRLISGTELEKLESHERFPILLQRYVQKTADLRITVVGNSIFGAEIRVAGEIVDWRIPGIDLEYRAVDVPIGLRTQCHAVLRGFGLRFGAFDFAVSKDGQPYFLEVNAVGEWAWLDKELGTDIREAIIEQLWTTRK